MPALVVGGLLLLILTLAVVRAAAVTRSEHRGGLCFLAHLGINVGKVRAAAAVKGRGRPAARRHATAHS